MNEPFFSFVGDRPAPDQTPITIIPHRAMLIRSLSGGMVHAEAGTAFETRRCDLSRIDPADFDVLD